jgi:hypothetical protein
LSYKKDSYELLCRLTREFSPMPASQGSHASYDRIGVTSGSVRSWINAGEYETAREVKNQILRSQRLADRLVADFYRATENATKSRREA